MGLGGGIFKTQNKVLPGCYINFVSVEKANAALSERGVAALPIALDWGKDEEVFAVESNEFKKNAKALFGYTYDAPQLKALRDLFSNARKVYFYRVNSGEKASCDLASALCSGERGNNIKIAISKNIDDESMFDVVTYLDSIKVDTQIVADAANLKANDFVNFKMTELSETAGITLTGGTNVEPTGEEYLKALENLEEYSFNALGCISTTESVKKLFVTYTKRMRDEEGIKFQTVLHNYAADFEGIINVKNTVTDDKFNEASLVYWVLGAQAGCEINRSVTNKVYDGEFVVNTGWKQSDLAAAIKDGEFIFHKVSDDIRVLSDINSFVSVEKDKNVDFQSNQTIRVLDQLGNDVAVLFNDNYLGKIQNDQAGRNSLWGDIVAYCKELQKIGAIENFESEDVVVVEGNLKKSVVTEIHITPTNAMEQLYMTVYVN